MVIFVAVRYMSGGLIQAVKSEFKPKFRLRAAQQKKMHYILKITFIIIKHIPILPLKGEGLSKTTVYFSSYVQANRKQ